MSRSNAAAINRRVNVPAAQSGNNIKPSYNPNTSQQTNNPQPSGFTLPQVITVIDNRLVALEKFMRESKQNTNIHNNEHAFNYEIQEKQNSNSINNVSINDLNSIINEFNSRFELFANEISELKDIVLKLQSYTMDVNKILLEEREQLYSNSITNDNLAITNEDLLNVNNDNNSADLKHIIKEEFSQNN
jgi:predicted transcriptional regulator